VPLRGHNFRTVAEFEVNAGDRVPFILTSTGGLAVPTRGPRPLPGPALRARSDKDKG
jgi:hypothetical protein